MCINFSSFAQNYYYIFNRFVWLNVDRILLTNILFKEAYRGHCPVILHLRQKYYFLGYINIIRVKQIKLFDRYMVNTDNANSLFPYSRQYIYSHCFCLSVKIIRVTIKFRNFQIVKYGVLHTSRYVNSFLSLIRR